jgi:XTP/dITP diphosphohydrolase
VLEGIPAALPALALADKVLSRASKVLPAGDDASGGPSTSAEPGPLDQQVGDRLLELVREARALGVDPEQALRNAVRRVADQVRAAE